MRRPTPTVVLALTLVTLGTFAPAIAVRAEGPAPSAGEQLNALFAEEWENRLRENPTFASRLGDRRYNDQWGDESLEAIERQHQHRQEVLRKLDVIDVSALSEGDRLNYTLFRKQYDMSVEGHQYRWYLTPVTHSGGIQTEHELADSLRFATVKDYEDWIARLRAFPVLMDQTIALMKEGMRAGILHPRVIMGRVPEQIAAQVVEDPSRSLFFKPFRQFPDSVPATEQERLTKEARQAIADNVVPAYRKFQKFFNEEYLPACPEKVGVSQIPRGKEFYAYRTRLYTTTDLTPEQIHQLGLAEVERIHAEMEKIIQQVGFKGNFEEFLNFLRTDPQFY